MPFLSIFLHSRSSSGLFTLQSENEFSMCPLGGLHVSHRVYVEASEMHDGVVSARVVVPDLSLLPAVHFLTCERRLIFNSICACSLLLLIIMVMMAIIIITINTSINQLMIKSLHPSHYNLVLLLTGLYCPSGTSLALQGKLIM